MTAKYSTYLKILAVTRRLTASGYFLQFIAPIENLILHGLPIQTSNSGKVWDILGGQITM
jgi:hypothetical protein